MSWFGDLKEWSKSTAIALYFSNRIYEKHFFNLLGFKDKDIVTYTALSHSKRRSRATWFWNNMFFPLIVIFCPFGFTILHQYFDTVAYSKTLLEIAISGSLTLVGFNVLRSTSSFISEKLDESRIPVELRDAWPEVSEEIKGIKSKFRMRVQVFSFILSILYVAQAVQFVNTSHPIIYAFLFLIVSLTVVSVLTGRFIYLLETNFLDDANVVGMIFSALKTQTKDFNQLQDRLNKQGLL